MSSTTSFLNLEMKYRLDTLVRKFEEWYPRYEKEAGPFSVGDWGVYPDFVYEAFLEDHPFLKETWEKLVQDMGGGLEGKVLAIEWLHKASEYEIQKSNYLYLPKQKRRKRSHTVPLRYRKVF